MSTETFSFTRWVEAPDHATAVRIAEEYGPDCWYDTEAEVRDAYDHQPRAKFFKVTVEVSEA